MVDAWYAFDDEPDLVVRDFHRNLTRVYSRAELTALAWDTLAMIRGSSLRGQAHA